MHHSVNEINLSVLIILFNLVRYFFYIYVIAHAYLGSLNLVKAIAACVAYWAGNVSSLPTKMFLFALYNFVLATAFYFMTLDKFWEFIKPYFFFNIIPTIGVLVFVFWGPVYLHTIFNAICEKPFIKYVPNNQGAQ